MIAIGETAARLDVRPILPRTNASIWSRTEQERDRLYETLSRVVSREAFEPLLLKSQPFVFPTWVNVGFWVPSPEDKVCTDRTWATISVNPKPFHQNDIEYSLTYSINNKKKTIPRIAHVDERLISEIIHFLLRKGKKPHFERFRSPWEITFWRAKNEIRQIKRDYLTKFSLLLFIGGIILFQFGSYANAAAPFIGLLWLCAGFLLFWLSIKRPLWVRCEGKPNGEPRVLTRVDSWQTVIFGLGNRESIFRSRFLAQLESPPTDRFRWGVEKVWYWGLDGKEEREQIVLSLGRGLVYCQIYQYGNDLYIGWDGHLNSGQWVETQLAKGIDRNTKKSTTIMMVNPGTQVLSEYDLMDLNCLMEWTHAQMVKLAKDFINELKIDQEIDFKILRGERQGLTGERKDPTKERVKTAFKRVG